MTHALRFPTRRKGLPSDPQSRMLDDTVGHAHVGAASWSAAGTAVGVAETFGAAEHVKFWRDGATKV